MSITKFRHLGNEEYKKFTNEKKHFHLFRLIDTVISSTVIFRLVLSLDYFTLESFHLCSVENPKYFNHAERHSLEEAVVMAEPYDDDFFEEMLTQQRRQESNPMTDDDIPEGDTNPMENFE